MFSNGTQAAPVPLKPSPRQESRKQESRRKKKQRKRRKTWLVGCHPQETGARDHSPVWHSSSFARRGGAPDTPTVASLFSRSPHEVGTIYSNKCLSFPCIISGGRIRHKQGPARIKRTHNYPVPRWFTGWTRGRRDSAGFPARSMTSDP